MFRRSLTLFMIFFSFGLSAIESTKDKGLSIAQEVQRRDTGWNDQVVDMQMILQNGKGESATRHLQIQTLEVDDDGDKSLTVFREPANVKGTAFLSFTHIDTADDQWLFLPALKRVKRISTANKSRSFVGSEFTYEDFASEELEKYRYKWLQDDILDGRETFVIERYPIDDKSGYKRQIVWIDKEIYKMMKIDYFDRNDKPLKTLTFHDYRQFGNQFWRAKRMEMKNHQNGKGTTLAMQHYQFGIGLSTQDFNVNTLKKIR